MRYRIDAIVESDRDEENLALYAEGVLEGSFKLKDLSVYQVRDLPPHAEQSRADRYIRMVRTDRTGRD